MKLLLPLIFVLLAPPPREEVGLRVTVNDKDGRPVAELSACRVEGDKCPAVATHRNGDDWYLGLPAKGTFRVRLSAPGFDTQEIEVVNGTSVKLKEKASPQPR